MISDKQIKKFCKDRNKAVMSFDPVKFKAFVEKYTKKGYFRKEVTDQYKDKDDDFIRGTMAKMAMNILRFPPETYEQAEAILEELGWSAEIYCEEE